MSPRRVTAERSGRVAAEVRRASLRLGLQIRDARLARRWSVRELAEHAGLSPDMVYRLEAGLGGSMTTCASVAVALGRHLELELVDPRRRSDTRAALSADAVHSVMGEFEARRLREFGFAVGVDEPYQHYQFAGRADLVAWDLEARALLHLENRTRFPDFQEMAGSYNAKRAYLGHALAARLGIGGWSSETHVVAALWSAEVLHAIRLRRDSFRALCADSPADFAGWWAGQAPKSGRTSTLIVLDPLASVRQRAFIGLEEALVVRPRYRGYADAVARFVAQAAA